MQSCLASDNAGRRQGRQTLLSGLDPLMLLLQFEGLLLPIQLHDSAYGEGWLCDVHDMHSLCDVDKSSGLPPPEQPPLHPDAPASPEPSCLSVPSSPHCVPSATFAIHEGSERTLRVFGCTCRASGHFAARCLLKSCRSSLSSVIGSGISMACTRRMVIRMCKAARALHGHARG